MRNASADSPWPISNNPFAKYNTNPERLDDNLNFPLWQLVRASTAAPTYFPSEVILFQNEDKSEQKEFVFVDGGLTMYNNPAFQMFLMAILDRYWPKKPQTRWQAGAKEMLIVRSARKTSPDVRRGLNADDMNLLFNATTVPSALMFAALNEQDLLCRVFGNCLYGDPLDRELGDVIGCEGPLLADQKLFTYVRYNAELTQAGLRNLGCQNIEPESVQKLDAVEARATCRREGQRPSFRRIRAG
jgi:hypothetical protein